MENETTVCIHWTCVEENQRQLECTQSVGRSYKSTLMVEIVVPRTVSVVAIWYFWICGHLMYIWITLFIFLTFLLRLMVVFNRISVSSWSYHSQVLEIIQAITSVPTPLNNYIYRLFEFSWLRKKGVYWWLLLINFCLESIKSNSSCIYIWTVAVRKWLIFYWTYKWNMNLFPYRLLVTIFPKIDERKTSCFADNNNKK